MRRAVKFEELIAWQKARTLAREVYSVSRAGTFSRDYGLAGQIQRAAVSIMSNIAEGYERTGRMEFHRFLTIAKGSCAEIRSQLYVALDAGYIDESKFRMIYDLADETGRVIGGLRRSMVASAPDDGGSTGQS